METRCRVRWCWVFLIFVWVSSGSRALAQSSVGLGTGIGTPGKEVVVPLYLTFDRQLKVGQIVIECRYPAGKLEFRRGESSFVAQRESVSVEFKLIKAGEDPASKSTEEEEIKITIRGSAGKSLPSGLVGSLFFNIPKSASHEVIPVTLAGVAALDTEGTRLTDVAANSGSISVEDPEPVTACFLYMH
jgi:hypothetical protein